MDSSEDDRTAHGMAGETTERRANGANECKESESVAMRE